MSDFSVLESVLRPLSYWYKQDNLEEVAINRAGQIWLRMRGKRAYPWVMYKDEKLSKEYLTDLLYIIANTYELMFDPLQGSPLIMPTMAGFPVTKVYYSRIKTLYGRLPAIRN
mgnify:CR=1 FL=1